uniref:NADH dehydrogenase [ubiquinone] 1 alpha subcomplex subunit 5 n=1 Tax=Gorilla gorilla gorilla TaxID=9595 RepID=A0A2I2Z8R4_GORGO
GGVLKKTTGLVGLAVCNTPHERLRILYTKILDVLEEIPKNVAYRKYTEEITNEKLAMVKAEPESSPSPHPQDAPQVSTASPLLIPPWSPGTEY